MISISNANELDATTTGTITASIATDSTVDESCDINWNECLYNRH